MTAGTIAFGIASTFTAFVAYGLGLRGLHAVVFVGFVMLATVVRR